VRDCVYLSIVDSSLATAFLIYDHLLTLDAEVKFVWSAKLGPGTCWFLAVRYIALSANIGVAVYYFRDLDHEVRWCLRLSPAPTLSSTHV
jgi:hypothetical protein